MVSPIECAIETVPIQGLLTNKPFSLPNPTVSIFITSLPILIKSFAKNEVSPDVTSLLSTILKLSTRVVVKAVPAIGDCITLSIVINTLEFGECDAI